MLKDLNKSVGILLGCLLGFLSFVNGQDLPAGQVVEKIIAKVDDEIILKSELDMAHLEFQRQKMFNVPNLKCEVLKTLVSNKLLLAKAVIDSVTVPEEEVDQQLNARMDQLLQAYGADEKTIIEVYGKTIEDLKRELRGDLEDQLILQKMQGKITNNVKVTPSEVRRFFNEIPKDSLPFFSTEFEVAQIVRYPKPGGDQKEKARQFLEDIRGRILNGEDFGALAMQYSNDPGSAADSGRLGWVNMDALVGEYVAAAIDLRPGELSQVTETQFGYHLIELLDRRGKEIYTRHILISPVANAVDHERSKFFLDSLSTMMRKDSIAFSEAANKYSEDARTKTSGGFFTDETGSSRVAANNTNVISPDLFFQVNGMKEGDISPVISFQTERKEDAYRIIYLRKKVRAHLANLDQDYQKIYNATLQEKKNKAIIEWFEKTKQEVFIYVDDEFSTCDILDQNN